jgi:hypothetical protein
MPSLARGTPSDAPPHRLRRPQYHRRPRRCTRAAAGHRLRRVRWRAWLRATASGPAWKGWRQVGHAGESRPPPTVPCVAAFTRQSTCTKPAEPRQAQPRSSGATSLLGCRQHQHSCARPLRTRASRAMLCMRRLFEAERRFDRPLRGSSAANIRCLSCCGRSCCAGRGSPLCVASAYLNLYAPPVAAAR